MHSAARRSVVLAPQSTARRSTAQRHFACLSVHVGYGTPRTSKADLKQTFEKYGKVWDVVPIESQASGRLLQQALVRFYEGEHAPGDTPDSAPTLPPPTAAEIKSVEGAVSMAIERLDGSELNGVKIRVRQAYDDRPTQLHEWYEDKHLDHAVEDTRPHKELFPVNPFHEPARLGDDYQRGFMAGFKLGLKDGSKQ
ncbi:hypothetical protein GQ54DRAFT_317200 [Martensiomyces pterosporus]|nr:hypothetical protein GQ54DRAFT_317200 [Martensiomyces pterosporus]